MRWRFPQPIGEAVRRELQRFGPAGGMGELVAAWPEAVGASSSVWAFELTKLEATIRERLAQALGDAAPPRLRFVPGRLPEHGAESVTLSQQVPPAPGALARQAGAEVAAAIEDEELRDLVARAAAASLARRYGGPDDRPLW